MKEEQRKPIKIRRLLNYVVAPIVFAVIIASAVVIYHFMTLDGEKYTPLAIVLFVLDFALLAGLLISLPIVRRKEIKQEMTRYDFESPTSDREEYVFDGDSDAVIRLFDYDSDSPILLGGGEKIRFDSAGVSLNGEVVPYEKISGYACAFGLNHCVEIEFELEVGEKYMLNLFPTAEVIRMLQKFKIEIENQKTLDYLLKYKEDAFRQILKYGEVRKDSRTGEPIESEAVDDDGEL